MGTVHAVVIAACYSINVEGNDTLIDDQGYETWKRDVMSAVDRNVVGMLDRQASGYVEVGNIF